MLMLSNVVESGEPFSCWRLCELTAACLTQPLKHHVCKEVQVGQPCPQCVCSAYWSQCAVNCPFHKTKHCRNFCYYFLANKSLKTDYCMTAIATEYVVNQSSEYKDDTM